MKQLSARTFLLALAVAATPLGAEELAPLRPPLADGEKPGETLTERLDRTDGVLKPPPVDGEMVKPAPPVGSDMPVVKPPAPPQPQQR